MELGQTRDLSEPFVSRRSLIHRSAAKDVERVMSRFQMVSLSIGSAPVQHTGYSFWKKPQEPDFVNLLDDDSLNPEDVVNCPICREEFKTLSRKRKEKCAICSRIVCSTCHANSLPIKGAVDGVARDLKLCTTCFTTITKEQKRLQLKSYFENSAKSGFTTFYEEMFFLVSVIQRDLPKLRYIMESPLTASSLKKAKELDSSLGKTLSDFEREIKNLEHFQVNTKKQQQLRDAIKMGFITSLSGTGPEYKLLHRQLETAATQPLAPETPDAPASKPMVHHTRSHSATHVPTPSQATPAPTMTPVLTSNRDKRRTILGSRLSSLTSLFTGDAKSTTTETVNSENGPYISGINPVLSPMSGGIRITILGDRFNFKCGVQIGEVDCPIVERGPGSLVVLSPAQTEPSAQDVCVYNPSGESCVMEKMLFYADDKMFAQESPTVPESNVYNVGSSRLMLDDDEDNTYNNNKHTNNNNTKTPTTTNSIQINNIKVNNNTKQDISSNSYVTPTTPPMSAGSGRFGSYTPKEQVNGSGRQTTPTKVHEVEEDKEITLVMIKPVMSPLQGTRVTMEVSHPLPLSSIIKVGGKTVQSHISDDNHCEVSFVSPPLPSGFQNIEIVMGHGKTVLLENLLQYENLIPQTDYANVTQRSAPSSSGRVWGKRA